MNERSAVSAATIIYHYRDEVQISRVGKCLPRTTFSTLPKIFIHTHYVAKSSSMLVSTFSFSLQRFLMTIFLTLPLTFTPHILLNKHTALILSSCFFCYTHLSANCYHLIRITHQQRSASFSVIIYFHSPFFKSLFFIHLFIIHTPLFVNI